MQQNTGEHTMETPNTSNHNDTTNPDLPLRMYNDAPYPDWVLCLTSSVEGTEALRRLFEKDYDIDF